MPCRRTRFSEMYLALTVFPTLRITLSNYASRNEFEPTERIVIGSTCGVVGSNLFGRIGEENPLLSKIKAHSPKHSHPPQVPPSNTPRIEI